MWSVIIFIAIGAAVVFICRKNMRNRVLELTKNAQEFQTEIKDEFLKLPEQDQDIFLNSLTQSESSYLMSIIKNNEINYSNNVWTIQQHLVRQQEIMYKLLNFKNK